MTETKKTDRHRPAPPAFRRFWALLLALASLTYLIACGEGESEVFDPGSTRDLDAEPDTLDHVLLALDRTYIEKGETGARSLLPLVRLYTGPDSLVSTVYLRFGLDDLPDTTGIIDGKLSFRVVGGSGDLVRMQLFEVSPDAPDWREDDFPIEPLDVVQPFLDSQTTAVQGSPGSTSDLSQVLTIPAALIRQWKSDPETNRGVALRLGLQSEGFLVVYSSEAVVTDTNTDGTIESVKTPELVVRYQDETVYTFEPDDDAYHMVGAEPEEPSEETLLIEQLVPHRALLLPGMPDSLEKGDTVEKAELFVRVVPGSFADTLDLSVGLYRVLSDWDGGVAPDTVSRETFATDVVTVTEESDTLRFDFGPQLQRWLDGTEQQGILLRIVGEGADDGAFRIYSSESSEETRPYVRVIRSKAVDPRWEVQ
ncbi:MAG: DNRLRE domain-containing protein [Candidatus Eisenbacteria bacterium]